MKKVYIKTFGCQMNVCDSAKLAGEFVDDGYTLTGSLEDADVVVVNTCSVREKPDNKAYSFIGNVGVLKRKKPDITVAITGCVVQKDKEKLLSRYPFIDVLTGTFNFFNLPKLIGNVAETGNSAAEILEHPTVRENEHISRIKPIFENPFVAYVTVQRGCDRFCSYCIVPFVRGRERSVPVELVVDEVGQLSEMGVKEVHLLGQNVDFYGKGLSEEISLSDLLYRVCEVAGIERVRFTTSHPCGFSEDIAYAIKNIHKLCEYVHLPPQSGSDRILKRMNRGYTKSEYLEKIQMLKDIVPDVAISGDFIVGFPGETVKDFEETLKLVEDCEFDQAFVFKYSARPFTGAYKYKDDVDSDEKTRRLQILNELIKEIAGKKNERLIGKVQKVLVEGASPKNGRFVGRTRTNKVVILDGVGKFVGKIVDVKITATNSFFLEGELVKNFRGVFDV